MKIDFWASLDLGSVTFGSFRCNIRFAGVPTTHQIPKRVLWQTPISTSTLTQLWIWCAFIEGPSGLGVAKFLDEAVSCGIRGSPLVIQPSGLNSVLRLLCVVNHVLLMNWFAATSCKSCQSCFWCFQSLLFSRLFRLCGETDRG